MSTPGAQAVDRAKDKGKAVNTQSFSNDGIGFTSRLSSLLTVAFIAFYVAALFVENWSSADDQVDVVLAATGDAFNADLTQNVNRNSTTDVTYSLDSYCITTRIPAWNNAEHQVCFKYMDNVDFCDELGENCVKATGCERFGNICYVRQVVKIALAAAIIFGVVAGTWSERGFTTTGSAQALAMIAGITAMGMWVNWSQKELGDDAKKLKLGLGGWLITIGWLLALVALLFGGFDAKTNGTCGDKKNRNETLNSTSYWARIASFLSVTTYICLLVAVANPAWTAVSDLGTVGDFQSTVNGTTSGTFGVWLYCIDETVPQFGLDAKHPVCLNWNDKIALTGSADAAECNQIAADAAAAIAQADSALDTATDAPESEIELSSGAGGGDDDDDASAPASSSASGDCGRSGLDRLETFNFKDLRRLTGLMVLVGALAAIVTDIYSEKNFIGMIFMFISAIGSCIGFSCWVHFQMSLSGKNGDASGLTFDEGGWVLVGAWIGAFLSFLLYGYSWKYPEGGEGTNSYSYGDSGSSPRRVSSTRV